MTATGSLRPMGLLTKALALAAVTLGFAVADAQGSVISMCNVPITMSDGTVLRANLFLPYDAGQLPDGADGHGLQQGRRRTRPAGMRRLAGHRRRRTRRSPKRASP